MIATDAPEDIYELSPAQNGMLFHDRLAPGSGVYVVQFVCTLEGDLDEASFEKAWGRVAARHAILRTAFHWQELEKPLQVVNRHVQIPFTHADWRGMEAAERASRLAQVLAADRRRGFELDYAPLMRYALYRTSQRAYEFVWTFHHILLDGWSTSLVLREVLISYEYIRRGSSPVLVSARGFGEFIGWLQDQDSIKAADFWKGMLNGYSVPSALPPGSRRGGDGDSPASASQRHEFSADTTGRLQSLARGNQITLNTFVQGAWALLLNRYSGQEDVVFGVTVSGRPAELSGVETIAGMFINTLPLRVAIDPTAKLLPWLGEIHARQMEMQQFEFSSLVDIRKWSELPHDCPIFESIVVFENYPVESSLDSSELSIRVTHVRSAEKTNFPLTVVAEPSSGLVIRLEYDASGFDSAAVSQILLHLTTLLQNMCENPDQQLVDLAMLPQSETRRMIRDWNQTASGEGEGRCYTDLFEEQAARTPAATAVQFIPQPGPERNASGTSLSFGELDRKANQLAHYLRRNGIGRGERVGICMARSIDMVVGFLAILKAGAAYVPLDPGYPAERLNYMVSDSNLRTILVHDRFTALFMGGVPSFSPDTCWDAVRDMPETPPGKTNSPGDLAYLIYTSGSTGQPKGVMISHAGLVNYVLWGRKEYRLSEGRGAPVQSPFGFDLTVTSLHCPLAAGKCVYLVDEENSVAALADLLKESGGYSLLNLTPAHVEMLNEILEPGTITHAAGLLVIGGEALQSGTLASWRRLAPYTRILNEYGPKETTVTCCAHEVEENLTDAGAVPIGRPIANTQIYLLDRHLRPVPVGAVGELFIGGAGVAYGYLNRPALTAEKFVPNPFSGVPGSRLYRSGDLARYRVDGVIEFCGRLDHQVKLRGFRIELGEIESALLRHSSVREALVVHDPRMKQLVGYIIPNDGIEPDTGTIRDFLTSWLPAHMIPSVLIPMESFPLTPNGKVDRKRLPKPDGTQPLTDAGYVAPRNPVEQILAQIWMEVLEVDKVGVYDNFFERGGHSLLATQVVSRLADELQIDLPLRRLFAHPTVGELAEAIMGDPDMRQQIEPMLAVFAEVSELSEDAVAIMLNESPADAPAAMGV